MNDDLTTVKPLDPVAAAGVSSADAVTSGITLLSEGSNIKYYGSTSADAETSIFSGEIVSQVKTDEKYRRRQLVNFTTLCWTFILEGWNDGSLGPLIPRIQQHYGITYSTISLIFVLECIGFILGAVLNVHLSHKLGFGKTIVLGTLLQVALYCILILAPPFPFIVFAYSLYGVAAALQNSQVNSFVASLNDPTMMAVLHTCYGVGALLSPLVATQFSTARNWSFHYISLFGLSVSTAVALIVVFRFRAQNDVLIASGLPPHAVNASPDNKYKQLLSLRIVHFLSLFALAYCGIEVTIGGWAVNYIMKRTGGGPSSGYVSTGFFSGLALGRVLLLRVTKVVGEQRVIFLYCAIAIGLEIFIWAVPVLIPSAIAISLVGLVLGPMYPIMMNQCGNFIPAHILSGAIGWICSFGMVGTAAVPLLTGILADAKGVSTLQPLLITMMLILAAMWAIAAYDHKRSLSAL